MEEVSDTNIPGASEINVTEVEYYITGITEEVNSNVAGVTEVLTRDIIEGVSEAIPNISEVHIM